ncbi:MAG: Lar family restriction alleviation protein [Oscillospiraceae bacterium]|nr:Lar family restriction alleviation protein [Oscillospiraceae bacterium]
MAELKPCPFCGETRYLCAMRDGGTSDYAQYTVVCDACAGGCGAMCGYQDSLKEAKEAKEAWNRREENA